MSRDTAAPPTTVLKLGGSVVTEKDEPETVDEAALDTAAAAIADSAAAATGNLVVVHGGGSFGHHHAANHGVSGTDGTREASAVVEIHDAMGRLNAAVVERLQSHGVGAVPVRPFSAGYRRSDGTIALPSDQVATMLGEEFCPVLHGDVIAHAGEGASILSGDDIVVSLAESLSADRVGLCSTVPGVLDTEDNVVERIDRFADVADAVGASDATDVTGGMSGKVRTLLALSAPAHVFGPSGLDEFLSGGTPGTLVAGHGEVQTDSGSDSTE